MVHNYFLALFILVVCRNVVWSQDTTNEECQSRTSDVRQIIIEMQQGFRTILQSQQRQLDEMKEMLVNMSTGCRLGNNNYPLPQDCSDIMRRNNSRNGVYTIYLGSLLPPVQVYCDMTTDGGGWLVFQRRFDGSENFYRNWTDYAAGFGKLTGEFWLGNDLLSSLTTGGKTYRLRVDLTDFNGTSRFAKYSNFTVASSFDKYRLTSYGNYSGTAGNSLLVHLGQQFSTYDQDNDLYPRSCAQSFKGAWWYAECHQSNLNGLYLNGSHTSYADGVEWGTYTGHYYSLKFTEMKMRPSDCCL